MFESPIVFRPNDVDAGITNSAPALRENGATTMWGLSFLVRNVGYTSGLGRAKAATNAVCTFKLGLAPAAPCCLIAAQRRNPLE